MTIADKFTKQPSEVQDYDIDFAPYLASMQNDELVGTQQSVSVAVSPAGELQADYFEISGSVIKVWLSGGVHGANYKVTTRAHTSGGRTKEHDILIRVRES